MFLIKCPECGYEFELAQQLKQDMVREIENEIREKTESEIRKENSLILQDLKNQIKERDNRIQKAEGRELDLKKREREIEEKKKALERDFDERIEKEKKDLESRIMKQMQEEFQKKSIDKDSRISMLEKKVDEAKIEAEKSLMFDMQDLKNQIEEKDRKISESVQKELELRKKTREIIEREKDLELEMLRKLENERAEIEKKVTTRIDEEHRQKSLEKDKKINDLTKMLEEAKRKAEQGSMQTQGEVLELDLEKMLIENFPADSIEPVPKGIKGADVIQRIYSQARKESGKLLWETKSTKQWSDKWIEKLKQDQREIGADIAIILSQAMPQGIENFGFLDGVWVCSTSSAVGLASALRFHLIELHFARNAQIGRGEKMEAIYQYLSGHEFRQKVEAIVEAFKFMQEQLDKERRAMTKIWKEREKQIERIMINTVGMYGDVKGIIGASLKDIPELDLDSRDDRTLLPPKS